VWRNGEKQKRRMVGHNLMSQCMYKHAQVAAYLLSACRATTLACDSIKPSVFVI
jgi:hypothetical protein